MPGLRGAMAWLAAGAVMALPRAALAEETVWRCAYTDQDAPAMACALQSAAAGAPDQAWMDRLPPIVRQIRTAPGTLEGEVVLVPLHAPPIDMALALRLARSVMCGRDRACRVEPVPLASIVPSDR